jgi:PKD repeat protein
MGINNKYTDFEKLLRDKVNNFEYPYDNKDWLDLEKKLPGSPKPGISPKNFFKYSIITAAVVIPALAILYFTNNSNKENNSDKSTNIPKTTINDQKNIAQSDHNSMVNTSKSGTNTNGQNSNTNVSANNNVSGDKEDIHKIVNKIISENNSSSTNEKKENNTVADQNGNKNVPSLGELIFADVSEGCAPLKVQFKPLITSDTITYQWAFGDSKTSSKKTPSHVYTKAGSYTVTLTVKFEKSQATKKFIYSRNISVYAKPTASFEYAASLDGDQYTFTDASSDALYWNWNFGDKSSSTEKNAEHSYKENGIYNTRLIITNAYGCSDTATKSISVKIKDPFFIPNSFIPGGVTTLFGPAGADMNPDGYKMSIYDKSGKLVFETSDLDIKWDGKVASTNTDALPGMYFWKITMKNKYGSLKEYQGYVTLIR